jgi:CO/xanthine dehydrogenase FAD-binding subunit
MTPLAVASSLAVHRSRKLIPEFRLHRPRSAMEAVALKAAAGAGAVFMAGGIDVVNRMKFGVPVTEVIHLGRLAGLDRIEEREGELYLGALVTHDRLTPRRRLRRDYPRWRRHGPRSATSGSAAEARSAATS